jgi:hypothetical protein
MHCFSPRCSTCRKWWYQRSVSSGATREPLARLAEHVGAGQVQLLDVSFRRQRQVADRRVVVQVDVRVARDLQVGLRSPVLRADGRLCQLALHGRDEAGEVLLHHVVARPGLHRFHRGFLADGAGHEDERDVPARLSEHAQGIDAAEARHPEVGQHGVPLVRAQRLPQAFQVLHAPEARLEAAAPKHVHGQPRVVLGVLHHQQADRRAHWAALRAARCRASASERPGALIGSAFPAEAG